jgi:Pseudouridylate synthase
MSSQKEKEISSMLKKMGLKSSHEATFILHSLLSQNVITPSQIQNAKDQLHPKPKQVNNSRYMTRHIALRFHYDGSTYSGLAQNVNSPQDNSVEKALFAALSKTCLIENRESCGYSRSGRTDRGVSAFGQVVALWVKSAFPVGTCKRNPLVDGSKEEDLPEGTTEEAWLQEKDLPKNHLDRVKCWVPVKQKKNKMEGDSCNKEKPTCLVEKEMKERDFAQMLNSVLPKNIRVLGWSPVTEEFSARFSTKSRTYRYFFVRRDLDLEAMGKGLSYMVGKHDFRNLCKMNCEEVDNFERQINFGKIMVATKSNEFDVFPYQEYNSNDEESMLQGENLLDLHRQICYFEIQGQAFLWHQIRCIASVLFMIGKSLEKPEVIVELLDIEKNPGKPCYPFAPELPLVLHQCEYENLRFGHSVQNLWRTCCDLESKWDDLVLAAERIRNGIVSLKGEAEVLKDDVLIFVKSILEEKRKKKDRATRGVLEPTTVDELPQPVCDMNGVMLWKDALEFIFNQTGLRPNTEGPTVQVHIPLMQRGRGTTYVEKIKSILSDEPGTPQVSSKRRRDAYENNIVKKKKANNKEEDDAFYKRMAAQGGSFV